MAVPAVGSRRIAHPSVDGARRAHESVVAELKRKGRALQDLGVALTAHPESIPFPAAEGVYRPSAMTDMMSDLAGIVEFARLEQLVRDERRAREQVAELEASAKRAGL
jgi:hypothetical protein